MKKVIMYHKPTCGTCRKERAYLLKAKISFEEIDIIKNPPLRDFLEKNIDEAHMEDFVNKHSKPYREFNLAKRRVSKRELIDLMLQDPNLIKRPIIIDGKKVYFGYKEI
jgi:arsenate reductase